MQNFGEEQPEKVIQTDADLHELLQRLGRSQGLLDQIVIEPRQAITVEDVAEATGLSPQVGGG